MATVQTQAANQESVIGYDRAQTMQSAVDASKASFVAQSQQQPQAAEQNL